VLANFKDSGAIEKFAVAADIKHSPDMQSAQQQSQQGQPASEQSPEASWVKRVGGSIQPQAWRMALHANLAPATGAQRT